MSKNKGFHFSKENFKFQNKNDEKKVFQRTPKRLMVFPFEEEIQVLKQNEKGGKENKEKLHISNDGTIKH